MQGYHRHHRCPHTHLHRLWRAGCIHSNRPVPGDGIHVACDCDGGIRGSDIPVCAHCALLFRHLQTHCVVHWRTRHGFQRRQAGRRPSVSYHLCCLLADWITHRCLPLPLLCPTAITACSTPLPSPLPPNLGPNEAGYTSILTLTCSLVASSTLNEAFWQRVWASENRTALYRGAALGFTTITLIVFLSGFGGWLAFAGGYITPGVTNPNLYLMQVGG